MTANDDRAVADLVEGDYRVGLLALVCGLLAVAWYLLAEFVIWDAAGARGEQPPGWAFVLLLVLSFVSLLAAVAGLILGLLARTRVHAAPPHLPRHATPGLLFSLAALLIFLSLWFVVLPLAE